MKATPLTADEARAASIDVIEDGRGRQAVHDTITAMRANRRTGSAHTKTRGEVSGNNRKIYRQKGTGNARHGDKRAPIFVKGGVVFGPRARDYSKKVSKTTRRLALRAALSARILGGDIQMVEDFSVSAPKTKEVVSQLSALGIDGGSVLVIATAFDDKTYLAARNVEKLLLMTADEANVEQLVKYRRIVITTDALQTLAKRTRKS